MTDNGSILFPFHGIAVALTNGYLQPGHTIWLRGGVYNGDLVSDVSGTALQPITIRAYPGERVIFNGSLTINGAYTIWRDIEFTRLINEGRQSAQTGSTPNDISIADGLSIYGDHTKIINCIIHDFVGDGIGLWLPAAGSELYGNLIFYNGWDAPDRGHGHGIYTQNDGDVDTIQDNVLWDGFELNIKVYTAGSLINNYHLVGNSAFRAAQLVALGGVDTICSNIFVGSINNAISAQGIVIQDNLTFSDAPLTSTNILGYNGGMDTATISGNRFIGPAAIALNAVSSTLTGNTIAGTIFGFVEGDYPDNSYSDYTMIGNVAIVRTNVYEPTRGTITIYNQISADSVLVDVSAVITAGMSYRLRNVQDYFNDWQMGTVAMDNTISIDMRSINHSVATPIGADAPSTTFPRFGVFVLEAA